MQKNNAVVVNIPDIGLNEALHRATGIPIGTDLTSDNLATISTLDASSMLISNLEGMEYCINLTEATFENNAITDLSPLSSLELLSSLNVGVNRSLTNTGASPISTLQNIANFEAGSTLIENLDFISNFSKLKTLSLGTCSALINLSGLEALLNLQSLDLQDCTSIRNISPLSNLTGLTFLNLNNSSYVKNVETIISGLINLETLYLDTISLSDLTCVSELSKLKELSVSGCSVPDLSPLSSLNSLSRLMAKQNKTYDISPLASLPQLAVLNVDENYLTTISSLASNQSLTTVTVTNNFITDRSQILALIKRGVLVEYTFNFIYGDVDQKAFFFDGNATLNSGESITLPLPLYITSDGSTYEVDDYNALSGDDGYTLTSEDPTIAQIISTTAIETNTLTLQVEVRGEAIGSTSLSVYFSPATGFSNLLPLTTGESQIPVTVTS